MHESGEDIHNDRLEGRGEEKYEEKAHRKLSIHVSSANLCQKNQVANQFVFQLGRIMQSSHLSHFLNMFFYLLVPEMYIYKMYFHHTFWSGRRVLLCRGVR